MVQTLSKLDIVVRFLSHLFDTPLWPTAITALNKASPDIQYDWVRMQPDHSVPDAQLRVRFRHGSDWSETYTLVRALLLRAWPHSAGVC